jgi:hypothetical protein
MFLMSFKIEMGLLLGTDNGSLCYKQLKEGLIHVFDELQN